MGARTILTGWIAMVGLRLLELARRPGHYIIEVENLPDRAPRWRVYPIEDQPGRWEQPRATARPQNTTGQVN